MDNVVKLEIKRQRENDEWRIFDEDLAAQIGYPQTPHGRSEFRTLIRRHLKTLKEFSIIRTVPIIQDGAGRGLSHMVTVAATAFPCQPDQRFGRSHVPLFGLAEKLTQQSLGGDLR
jgi:hypothetical protein